METGLKNKVVVITGASGGIGGGIARAFAAEGARLVLQYRSGKQQVEKLVRELDPAETLVVRANLAREPEAKNLFQSALRRFKRVDTLIANAASWEMQDCRLGDMPLKHWRKTMDGVLTSTFLSLREFLKITTRQRQGNVVVVASTAAVFGEAGHADYAAAKAAIAYGLTRSLKNELARIAPHTANYCGGRINCISPGWTAVPRLAAKLGNPAMVRKAAATMALPQIGRPSDIGNAAVFLASDLLARHITGQNLVIAGGMEGRWLWQPDEIDPAIA